MASVSILKSFNYNFPLEVIEVVLGTLIIGFNTAIVVSFLNWANEILFLSSPVCCSFMLYSSSVQLVNIKNKDNTSIRVLTLSFGFIILRFGAFHFALAGLKRIC